MRKENCVEGRFCSRCDTSGNLGCAIEGSVGQVGVFLKLQMRRDNGLEWCFRSRSDRWGRKTVWEAVFAPDVTHQEIWNVP